MMVEKIHLALGVENEPEDALLAITRPANHLVIAGRNSTAQNFNEFVLIPSLYFKPWTLARVYFREAGGNIYDVAVENSRDQLAALQLLYNVPDQPHAQIFWGGTEAECAVIGTKPCYCTEPHLAYPHTTSWGDRLELMVPGYEAFYGRRAAAKAKLLRKLQTQDSLAEAEKQVDLLTAMVLELVQRVVPPAERPAWWQNFAEVMSAHDSTAIKGREAAIADIASRKATIRALVATYNAERQG